MNGAVGRKGIFLYTMKICSYFQAGIFGQSRLRNCGSWAEIEVSRRDF